MPGLDPYRQRAHVGASSSPVLFMAKKQLPAAPFWQTTTLEQMSEAQWESLCDGCGRCCLVKLEDEDSGKIYFTDVGCELFRQDSCRCANYPKRQEFVSDCIKLTPHEVRTLKWLPPTCAYKLVADGKDLPWWHPLVSGDPETVVQAGVSVRGRVKALENDVPLEELPDFVVAWPGRTPVRSRRKP
jgi:uncharacterized cysteine cluster protein YcgN (CxxCxxCC family)